ncbi:hypothetical protein H920_00120 [Fukomys damarensis]|uniref:Uncharacterized protein n=1 Tax=Fukomys damarensis TaxID=885580 RepID=A0A091ERR0_FUKDA|nr:hypothetical protein H920_00120 [Fukomys damarensis]
MITGAHLERDGWPSRLHSSLEVPCARTCGTSEGFLVGCLPLAGPTKDPHTPRRSTCSGCSYREQLPGTAAGHCGASETAFQGLEEKLPPPDHTAHGCLQLLPSALI